MEGDSEPSARCWKGCKSDGTDFLEAIKKGVNVKEFLDILIPPSLSNPYLLGMSSKIILRRGKTTMRGS